MKQAVFISLLLITYQFTNAQSFAINTDGSTANTSALLDVKSTAKGMLIPRMSKTEKNAIATPATGLLIFQNAPDSIGFYYYSGSTWLWLANTAQQDTLAWKTRGNAGTSAANHFFGTSDNIPLSFRQNNVWMGRWNSAVSNYFIGDSAGSIITTGIQNIGIGTNTMQNSTVAYGNVAVGNNALEKNISGSRNTAIGDSALFDQSYSLGSGYISDNTAIGNSAMRYNKPVSQTTGIKNVAIGNDAMYTNTIGNENVAIGVSAMRENTSGGGNTVIGRSANRLAKIGDANSYVGYATGYSDSTGSLNSGLGAYALYLHQTGDYNIALGAYAMQNDSSGIRNTIIGSFAGRNNDTAKLNVGIGYAALTNNNRNFITAIGAYAGMNNGTGSTNANEGIENTMIGYAAMSGNSNGSQNTAIGYKAMSLTDPLAYVSGASPSRNVAIGDSALRRNLGNDNVGIGFRALGATLSNASSANNIAVGSNAMFNNQSGAGNVAMGYEALNESEASSYNVAIGNAAMLNHKRTGFTYNVAVGASALEQDITGFQNTAIGTSSFRSNTLSAYNSGLGVNSGYFQKGSDNTFIGAYAGYGERLNVANVGLDIGIKNTGLGAGALYRLANGNYNVALGQDALLYDSSGSYNVAVGHNSLPAITSGNYNVGLGYNVNANSGTLTNTTTIGANAYVTQSNSLILGSINGVNGATANTSVGIGTSAPAARLDVDANFKLGANGSTLNDIIKSTETYDIPSLAPGAVDIQTFAVANATIGSAVSFSPLFALPDGISISYARVSAAGVVEVKVVNAGTATQNPSSMSFILVAIR